VTKGFLVMVVEGALEAPSPMNFISDGFQWGLLIVSISFQHLLVICEEIGLQNMQDFFCKLFYC